MKMSLVVGMMEFVACGGLAWTCDGCIRVGFKQWQAGLGCSMSLRIVRCYKATFQPLGVSGWGAVGWGLSKAVSSEIRLLLLMPAMHIVISYSLSDLRLAGDAGLE
jgi:hypothetical protein